MKEQLAVQTLLRKTFDELQRANPRYSLRAYAKKVGIHVGALSSILNGKRNISRDLAERVAKRLYLDPQQRSELLDLFPQKRVYKKESTALEQLEPRYLEFSAHQFKIVAEWEHFAVMSLLNCKDFENDPKWIAHRLNISSARAKVVLDRLLELGLFQVNDDGSLIRSKKSFRTTDDIADLSIKRGHEETLNLAKESLYRDSVSERDFTHVTMAINPKNLPVAKELIRKFQDEISDLLESGERTEVYRLSTALFPLSKITTKDTL